MSKTILCPTDVIINVSLYEEIPLTINERNMQIQKKSKSNLLFSWNAKSKAGFKKYGKAIVAIAVTIMQATAPSKDHLYRLTCSTQIRLIKLNPISKKLNLKLNANQLG
jgi:hypothetical protein